MEAKIRGLDRMGAQQVHGGVGRPSWVQLLASPGSDSTRPNLLIVLPNPDDGWPWQDPETPLAIDGCVGPGCCAGRPSPSVER